MMKKTCPRCGVEEVLNTDFAYNKQRKCKKCLYQFTKKTTEGFSFKEKALQ